MIYEVFFKDGSRTTIFASNPCEARMIAKAKQKTFQESAVCEVRPYSHFPDRAATEQEKK
jgi:hypothetical protein